MIIGICGKSGSGKTTLANEIIKLTENKAIHLDIDKVGHRSLLLPNVKEKLVNSFGNSILKKDMVDRKKLAKIVFNSKEAMNKLTDITWKYMQIEIDNFLNTNKDKDPGILSRRLKEASVFGGDEFPLTFQTFNDAEKKEVLDMINSIGNENTKAEIMKQYQQYLVPNRRKRFQNLASD